jgi:hypothetical protein
LELIERKFGLFSIFVWVAGDQAARPSTTDRSTIADVVWPGNDLSQYGTDAIAAACRRRLSTRGRRGHTSKARRLRREVGGICAPLARGNL